MATEFNVDTRNVPKKADPLIVCRVIGPSGNKTDTEITKTKDGTFNIAFTPTEEGNCSYNYKST